MKANMTKTKKIKPIITENLIVRNIGGRDLAAEFYCTCPSPLFKDNPELAKIIKKKIYLSGYNDDYFFEDVNKEPREFKCECGKKYSQQWIRGCVILKRLN